MTDRDTQQGVGQILNKRQILEDRYNHSQPLHEAPRFSKIRLALGGAALLVLTTVGVPIAVNYLPRTEAQFRERSFFARELKSFEDRIGDRAVTGEEAQEYAYKTLRFAREILPLYGNDDKFLSRIGFSEIDPSQIMVSSRSLPQPDKDRRVINLFELNAPHPQTKSEFDVDNDLLFDGPKSEGRPATPISRLRKALLDSFFDTDNQGASPMPLDPIINETLLREQPDDYEAASAKIRGFVILADFWKDVKVSSQPYTTGTRVNYYELNNLIKDYFIARGSLAEGLPYMGLSPKVTANLQRVFHKSELDDGFLANNLYVPSELQKFFDHLSKGQTKNKEMGDAQLTEEWTRIFYHFKDYKHLLAELKPYFNAQIKDT